MHTLRGTHHTQTVGINYGKRRIKHLIDMKSFIATSIVFLLFLSNVLSQQDSINISKIDFENYCNNNFSPKGDDSLFVNFYILNFKDTVFFKSANCILTGQTTTPTIFKRRILNGWAEGDLQVYYINDSTYNWTYGEFKNGVLISGSFYEYFLNGKFRLTGQYAYGHRHGIWTWYYPNGKIERIITYELAEPIKEIEFDIKGNIIEQFDVIKEKTNANKTYKR